jgi:hypothetical protein
MNEWIMSDIIEWWMMDSDGEWMNDDNVMMR